MDEAAQKAGAEIYNVDAQPRRVVLCDDAEVFREILLPANLSEFDLILSVPKLKTHQLTYITCAVKNLFGLMPGAAKKQAHMLAPRPDEFAALLCDLFGLVRPQAAFVDGIVGMEGNGPNNGKLRHAGMVAASADCVALDSVCAQVMGMDPLRVPLLAQCEQRKLGTADPGLITVLGDPPAAFAPPNFKKPPAYASRLLLQSIPRRTVRALLGATSTVHARIDQSTCQRCGECARNCPSGAITLNQRTKRYSVNRRKCISCYCCDEVCPFDSIRMQPTHFRRILDGARKFHRTFWTALFRLLPHLLAHDVVSGPLTRQPPQPTKLIQGRIPPRLVGQLRYQLRRHLLRWRKPGYPHSAGRQMTR